MGREKMYTTTGVRGAGSCCAAILQGDMIMLRREKIRKFLISFVFFNLIFGLILVCLMHALNNEDQIAEEAIDSDAGMTGVLERFMSDRGDATDQTKDTTSHSSELSFQSSPIRLEKPIDQSIRANSPAI